MFIQRKRTNKIILNGFWPKSKETGQQKVCAYAIAKKMLEKEKKQKKKEDWNISIQYNNRAISIA